MDINQQKQSIIDYEHLRLLSLFHYIVGIITLVISLFVGLYFMFISVILRNPSVIGELRNMNSRHMPLDVLNIMMVVFGFIMIFIILLGVGQILSGYFLKQRKAKWFSYIIAAITCLSIPYGTILGICTFIVLGRYSVSQLYLQLPNDAT